MEMQSWLGIFAGSQVEDRKNQFWDYKHLLKT